MKKKLIIILIPILKVLMNILYFFMKFGKTKNKVIFISRQSDSQSLDFKFLKEALLEKEPTIEIKVFCKKIGRGPLNKIKYCFYMMHLMKNLANSKVCVVDGYAIPVSMLKQRKELVVIQVWHALGAIKKFGYQAIGKKEGRDARISEIMNMHKNYTYVLAPSNSTKEFYKEAFNAQENQMLIMGMPRIDYIIKNDNKIIERITEEYPVIKEKRNILYVPTFRMGKRIETEQLINSFDKEKYNLIIKKHPLDDIETEEGYVVDNKFSSESWLNVADYVITDYSAIAFESALKNKPTFFYLYDIEEYEKTRGLNINLFKEMPKETSKDINEIVNKIDNENYDYDELKRFTNKYIETKEKNTDKLTEFILKKLKGDK